MYRLDEKIIEGIEYYYEKCRDVADFLTDNPETGGNEDKAVQNITAMLKNEDYEITVPFCGVDHSFLAVKKGREKMIDLELS